jgi:hypothetical protein
MTKKEILALMLPCMLIVFVAAHALRLSYVLGDNKFLANTPDFVKYSQQDFAELTNKIGSGELKLTAGETVMLLRDSHESNRTADQLISYCGKFARTIAWAGFISVILQVYIVLRIRKGPK